MPSEHAQCLIRVCLNVSWDKHCYYQRIHIQILLAITDLIHYTQAVGSGGLVYRGRPTLHSEGRSLAWNTLLCHSLLLCSIKRILITITIILWGILGFLTFQAFSSGPNSKYVVNGTLIILNYGEIILYLR